VTLRQANGGTNAGAAGSLAHSKRSQSFRTRARAAQPYRGRAIGVERGMRYSSHADLVQVRTWASGIAGATTDGAGASPPWMTTSSPLLTSEFVRPRLERVTRSRMISLGSGAVDESGAQERSGWSWGACMGAGDPGAPERSGWSWRACMGAGHSGSRRPSERAGWSWRAQPPRAHGEGRPSERNGRSRRSPRSSPRSR
jgi:hypothetical protein